MDAYQTVDAPMSAAMHIPEWLAGALGAIATVCTALFAYAGIRRKSAAEVRVAEVAATPIDAVAEGFGKLVSALQEQMAKVSGELAATRAELASSRAENERLRRDMAELKLEVDHLNQVIAKAGLSIPPRQRRKTEI